MRKACFIDAALRVCLNVEFVRPQIRIPLRPTVANAGYISVATAKLRRRNKRLRNWSCGVPRMNGPFRVLQSVFGRHRTLCNNSWSAKRWHGLVLHLLRQRRLVARTTMLDTHTRADVTVSAGHRQRTEHNHSPARAHAPCQRTNHRTRAAESLRTWPSSFQTDNRD